MLLLSLILPTPRILATGKIPKRMPLNVCFSISRSQDRAINCQRIIQTKPTDCLSDTFSKLRNALQTLIQLKRLMTTG